MHRCKKKISKWLVQTGSKQITEVWEAGRSPPQLPEENSECQPSSRLPQGHLARKPLKEN